MEEVILTLRVPFRDESLSRFLRIDKSLNSVSEQSRFGSKKFGAFLSEFYNWTNQAYHKALNSCAKQALM